MVAKSAALHDRDLSLRGSDDSKPVIPNLLWPDLLDQTRLACSKERQGQEYVGVFGDVRTALYLAH